MPAGPAEYQDPWYGDFRAMYEVEHDWATGLHKRRNKLGIVVAANNSPAWMKAAADYTCDAVNDEVQIQAAIDEAESYVVGGMASMRAPDIFLLPGIYFLAATVTARTGRLLGAGLRSAGVRVYWNGTPGGGPAIARVGDSNSAWEMANIAFRGDNSEVAGLGASAPETWIDLTNDQVDQGFRLHDLYFSGGNYQIKMGGWFNLQWSDLRFDHWREYAIQCAPGPGQYQSQFSIQNFTADHNGTNAGNGKGFLHIDATNANAQFGSVKLAQARIEVNRAWVAPQAIVNVTLGAATPARAVDIILDQINYQDAISMASDVAVYLTGASASSQTVTFIKFTPGGLSAYLGGQWLTQLPSIPLSGYGLLSINTQGSGGPDIVANHVSARPQSFSDHSAFTVRKAGEAQDRWRINNDGVQQWGSGSAAADTQLNRVAPNVVGVGADDCIRTGRNTTANRPSASAVGQGSQFFDTTLNKPIWSDGTNWRDAAGTVV